MSSARRGRAGRGPGPASASPGRRSRSARSRCWSSRRSSRRRGCRGRCGRAAGSLSVDEVIALDELAGGEVGAAAEAAAERPVGDPGVEHRDRRSRCRRGASAAARFSQAPTTLIPPGEVGRSGVPVPFPGQEAPLFGDPGAGHARQAAVRAGFRGRSGVPAFFFGLRLGAVAGGGRDVVRRRVVDRRVAAQARAPPRGRRRPAGSSRTRARALALELDDHLVRDEGRVPGRARSRQRPTPPAPRRVASRAIPSGDPNTSIHLCRARHIPCF